MWSSEEYDKKINNLLRRAGVLPDETDDVNTAQKQMAEAELKRIENTLKEREASARHIANLANRAITVMNRYLYVQGIDNLTNLDKATVLKVISEYLEKKAWSIMEEGELE